ncbi:hypothetical protein, conserved [Trypanosoma brucei brucei TREU927]|uniref:Uncharacterized protein n=1 Tax=Trypanosoma brucei brucei (strain 927/4 GUTat10.1) TaxID=185431 RepID=Q4GYJ3_TRYB2|nr:hypothetical protein, conserved [Trypanosoma brucei brucei TREU927]CAJ16591.1 hypothetical protein, conserved [Trypanosoma brucei brucei TREU927]
MLKFARNLVVLIIKLGRESLPLCLFVFFSFFLRFQIYNYHNMEGTCLMAHATSVRCGDNDDLLVPTGDPPAPYQSPSGGRSYYPTRLFKRGTHSLRKAPDEREHAQLGAHHCATINSRKKVGISGQQRSRGVSGHLRLGAAAAPLLGRYRPHESAQKKSNTETFAEQRSSRSYSALGQSRGSLSQDQGVFGNAEGASHRAMGENRGKSNDLPNTPTVLMPRAERGCMQRNGGIPTASSKAAKGPDSFADNKQLGTYTKSEYAPPALSCADAACIHGRDGILDYISMCHRLRGCHDELRNKDAELDKLRRYLASLESENAVVISRLEAEIKNMVRQHKKKLADVNERHERKFDKVLSENLAFHERVVKEAESLRAELNQERLEHARTRCELQETQHLSNLFKQQLECFQVTGIPGEVRQASGSLATEAHRCRPCADKKTYSAAVEAPAPAWEVGEELVAEEDCKIDAGIDESNGRHSPFEGLLSTQTCGVPLGNDAEALNLHEGTSADVSVPSFNCSAVFELGGSEGPSFTSVIKEGVIPDRVEILVGTRNPIKRDIIEAEELPPTEKVPPPADQQGGAGNALFDKQGKPTVNPFLLCNRAAVEERYRPVDGMRRPSAHLFDEFVGREAVLCKELMRALLEKEKHVAELKSAGIASP